MDVRGTDLDAKYHIRTESVNVLVVQEKRNKRKHLNLCLDKCRHFTPLFVSTDVMLGRKATNLVRILALKFSCK